MKQQERLKFCSVCKLQRWNDEKGIICSLTNAPASFEVSCTMYSENAELKNKAEAEITGSLINLQVANKGKRFVNNLLDGIFAYSFMKFIISIIVIFSPDVIKSFENNQEVQLIFILISTIAYYLLFEGISGRTMGKLFTQTKVVDSEGKKPDFSTILLRTFCRFIPLNALSFLFATKGWHDALSKTSVVDSY